MELNGIRLESTCDACPEQYDAYIGDKLVGYLRLRHGYFSVECPWVGGEEVYTARPEGNSCFMPEERDGYLQAATRAIRNYVEANNGTK